MSSKEQKCKITVLKRTLNRDLRKEYLSEEYQGLSACDQLHDGQEFLLEGFEELASVPEGFCDWAWADIRQDVLRVAWGGDQPGLRQPGVAIAGCTDWFRPVIFKIERIEDE